MWEEFCENWSSILLLKNCTVLYVTMSCHGLQRMFLSSQCLPNSPVRLKRVENPMPYSLLHSFPLKSKKCWVWRTRANAFLSRFQNGPCAGGNNMNGTCYTEAECESRGGTNGGTCASGFGVCCICKFCNKKNTVWLGPFCIQLLYS